MSKSLYVQIPKAAFEDIAKGNPVLIDLATLEKVKLIVAFDDYTYTELDRQNAEYILTDIE